MELMVTVFNIKYNNRCIQIPDLILYMLTYTKLKLIENLTYDTFLPTKFS